MPATIRPAALADLQRILDIERQSSSAAHWTAQQYNSRIERGNVLVAEAAGQICGFLCAPPVVGEWELENVVVAAAFQRRGIASELISALINRAKSSAVSVIHLEVRESNLSARGLYRKHGFLEVGRRPRYYANPEEDAILYALPIRQVVPGQDAGRL